MRGMPSPRILVVEDEPSIRDAIQYAIESDGCDVKCCGTSGEALAQLDTNAFDLVVLDVGLPDLNGFDTCRKLRERHTLPVLFLTARSDEIDRVVGLEIGGDDYVTKPFSPRELSARVRAILRRTGPASVPPAQNGSVFEIDTERIVIRYQGTPLDLSRYEYRLLAALIARPGRVFTRAQLMDAAWEEPEASMERTVDTHIKSLRAKLHAVRADTDPIRTHRGFGYSLEQIDAS
jgi:two-component system, OmpR family, catabolic regulation response regulator CreB